MRIAVYNRFLRSMGGGERHSGMLAQVLAGDGHQVELLGHAEVDKDILSDYLSLDLAKVSIRVLPEMVAEDIEDLSVEYDVFVNASHMSRLKPRAAHNLYLCYFPTPTDHELVGWRRLATRTLGFWVRTADVTVGHGSGWFAPEGGRGPRWRWNNGRATLVVGAGEKRVLEISAGRPGAPGSVEVAIIAPDVPETRFLVTPDGFSTHRANVGSSLQPTIVQVECGTFVPGGSDQRPLGFAAASVGLTGARFGLRERVARRFSWMLDDPTDLSFLKSYERVLANSEYTRGWIRKLWGVDSDVLYPPIRLIGHRPGLKQQAIVHVGRFFDPRYGHGKRQLEIVHAFGDLVRRGRLPGWQLHLVGGCEDFQRPYLRRVQAAAEGLPVTIHDNAPRRLVEDLLATSPIFWAATGLDEHPRRRPWALEHFGMTTVEAMSAGCVPIVIDRAGQQEIVRDGRDGFRWSTIAELHARTEQVAADPALREALSRAALERARAFSDEAFADRWHAIAGRLGLETEADV